MNDENEGCSNRRSSYGDIFAEQLGVTLSLNTDSVGFMTNRRGFFAMAQKIRPNLATMTGVELLGILVDLVALLYYLWERSAEKLMPGDVLILYTDGVTEAQNENDSLHFLVRVALNLFCKPTWADRLP